MIRFFKVVAESAARGAVAGIAAATVKYKMEEILAKKDNSTIEGIKKSTSSLDETKAKIGS